MRLNICPVKGYVHCMSIDSQTVFLGRIAFFLLYERT
jgi:hypothetical protein